MRTHVAGLILVLGALLVASCERAPNKSDYVSDRVREICGALSGDDLRACRIAVIKQFKDTSLEEMKARYPVPEPRARPSCGLW